MHFCTHHVSSEEETSVHVTQNRDTQWEKYTYHAGNRESAHVQLAVNEFADPREALCCPLAQHKRSREEERVHYPRPPQSVRPDREGPVCALAVHLHKVCLFVCVCGVRDC